MLGLPQEAPHQGRRPTRAASAQDAGPTWRSLSTSSSLKDIKPQVAALLVQRGHQRGHHLRGAGLPHPRERRRVQGARQAGPAQEGLGARHRREPRLRDGRAGAHAHRPLRAGAAGGGDPGGGRGHAPPAPAAQGRGGPQPEPVPARRHRGHRPPRRPGRVGPHDRRRPRLEARPGGRDARARDRAARPRHASTCASPRGPRRGSSQSARGYRDGELAISLDLQMYVGAESPRDHVLVDGDPPIDTTIAGGVAGDIATAAITVNA